MFSITWIIISSLSFIMAVTFIDPWFPDDIGKRGKAEMELAIARLRNEDNWKKMVFVLLFFIGMLPVGTILCLADTIINHLEGN